MVWTPIAKDGFDLPPGQQRRQPADRTIAVGETYDFAYTPAQPGELRLELRTGVGGLLFEQVVVVLE